VDHTSIRDNQLEHDVDVYLRPEALWCEECEKTDCVHVKYAVALPQVQEAYKNKGLKPPSEGLDLNSVLSWLYPIILVLLAVGTIYFIFSVAKSALEYKVKKEIEKHEEEKKS